MDYEMQIKLTALNQASAQVDAVSKSVGNLNKATASASKSSQSFGQKMVGLGSQLNVLGQRMTWMVSVPLLAFGNKSIETALEIKGAWLRMQKVFNGTEEDLVSLKESAWNIATTFGVSFEEASNAMTEFTKAGIDSKDELEKLTNMTARTSILFDTDMANSIDGVKALMFGYGLTVNETAQALDAINIIADQTTASEAGVLEVLTKVSGTAKQAGFSIREVAAAQGVFEASAIPAGRAGNALKSILTSLTKQSDIAKDQWKAMGVDMTSTTWKTSNASEKLTILAKKLAEVRKSGDEVKLKKFTDTLGEVGTKLDGLNITMDSPIEKLKLIKATLIEAGKAGDTKKIEEISSALSTLGVEGGTADEKITNLNKVISDFDKSGMTLELNDLNEGMATLVGKFQINNLNVLLQDLAKNFDDDASSVSIFYDALSKSDKELVNAAWGTQQLTKVLDSNVVKMAAAKQEYRKAAEIIGNKLIPIKIELMKVITKVLEKFESLSPITQDWIVKIGLLAAVLGPAVAFVGLLITVFGFLSSGVGLAVMGAIGFIVLMALAFKEKFNNIKDKINEVKDKVGELWQKIKDSGLIELAKAVFGAIGDTIKNQLIPNFKLIWEALKPLMPYFKIFAEYIGVTIIGAIMATIAFILGAVNAIAKFISGVIQTFEGVIQFFTGFFEIIIGIFTLNGAAILEGWNTLWTGVYNIFAGFYNMTIGTVMAFVDGVIGFFYNLYEELVGHSIVPDMINAIVDYFVNMPGRILNSLSNMGNSIWNVFKIAWDYLSNNTSNWIDSVVRMFRDLPGRIKSALSGLKGVLDSVNNTFSSWASKAGNSIDNVMDKLKSFAKKAGTSISKAFDKMFADGGVVQAFNNGGMVYAASGYLAKGKDTVPAMLSPGEMVLNKSQQGNLFDILSGRMSAQTAGGPTVNINVGTMVASRGEQREFARKIKTLISENEGRFA